MRWLIRMLARSNKSKRGFTLIELMVVVIIVGILAAAAVPLYNFARSRAYASEGKAAIGTIRSAELVYKLEDPADLYLTGDQGADSTVTTTLLTTLGVDVDTNTWWTETDALFSVGESDPFTVELLPQKGDDAAGDTYIYAEGKGGKIIGIKLWMNIGSGNWYEVWPP